MGTPDTTLIRVYDCVSFFNELDLLELRLQVLAAVVDRFIIVEADRTHTNRPKPFYFEENRARFAPFLDRITYIKLTAADFPPFSGNAWVYENIQRNAASRGLADCRPDDLLIVTDLDEIPNPATIQQEKIRSGIRCLRQKYYGFWLNNYCFSRPDWIHPKILQYGDLAHEISIPDEFYLHYGGLIPSENQHTTLTKVRMSHFCHDWPIVPDGGWHFSSIGTVKKIAEKLVSYAHREFSSAEYTDLKKLERRLYAGKDMANLPERNYVVVPLDDSFPEYLHRPPYLDRVRPYHFTTGIKNGLIRIRFWLFWKYCGLRGRWQRWKKRGAGMASPEE